MAIDLIKKSNRLLGGRRYTLDTYVDSQEAFTSVFDLNSTEIYTQTSLIPTASLPFSGSSQNGYYYTATKTISSTPTGNDVIRYWYRHQLTKSNISANGIEAWLFISASGTSTDAQRIEATQQTSFISPKYSISGLSTVNAEDATPGYLVRAWYSNDNLATSSSISPSLYNFDYKTGILQFSSSTAASSIITDTNNGRVYLTAYQYVGETLFARLNTISSSIPPTASYAVSSSFALISISSSFATTASYVLNAVSSSFALTASYINPLFISASAAAYGFGSGGGGSVSESIWIVSGTTLYTNNGYKIQATGSLTISGDDTRFGPDIFIVKKSQGGPTVFKVTTEGAQFPVNNANPITNPTDYGQLFFTSQSLYISLD